MFDVASLIESGGLLVIALVVFAESGLLVGFFLPGDTLLFGAGLAASQGQFNIVVLICLVVIAAILGDNVGYSIGRRSGKRIFRKDEGILFQRQHIERAQAFYDKHGGKTIILARFVPVVRTFAPVVAGVGKMPRSRFMFFNVIGGLLWGIAMPLLGFWLGKRIPHLDRYIEWVMVGVVVMSLLLAFGHLLKEKRTRQRMAAKFKLFLRNLFLNKKVN